jgi:two-component system, LytTR family, sensor histidine kinase AlgZ
MAKISADSSSQHWLPDLCNPLALLRLMLLAVLITLVLTLLRQGIAGFNVDNLGMMFLYAVWVVYISAAGLCFICKYFGKLSVPVSAILTVLWLFVAATISALAGYQVMLYYFLDPQISQGSLWAETVLTTVIFGTLVLRFLFVHHQLQMQQQRLMQAQFDALQARIRPHFLFNSLNSIATLVGIDPQRAEDALLNLSDILRATLGEDKEVTIQHELDVCRKYLDIEALRMGDRLQIDMDIDSSIYGLRLPPFCLQPLMENAMLHGLQKRPDGGCLLVKIDRDNTGFVRILIENPLPENFDGQSSGAKSALVNIGTRLESFFPAR